MGRQTSRVASSENPVPRELPTAAACADVAKCERATQPDRKLSVML